MKVFTELVTLDKKIIIQPSLYGSKRHLVIRPNYQFNTLRYRITQENQRPGPWNMLSGKKYEFVPLSPGRQVIEFNNYRPNFTRIGLHFNKDFIQSGNSYSEDTAGQRVYRHGLAEPVHFISARALYGHTGIGRRSPAPMLISPSPPVVTPETPPARQLYALEDIPILPEPAREPLLVVGSQDTPTPSFLPPGPIPTFTAVAEPLRLKRRATTTRTKRVKRRLVSPE